MTEVQVEDPPASPGPEPATVRIRGSRGRGSLDLHELLEYRELIFFLLWRQVKGDYRQMALGPLWIIFRPVVSTLLYVLIFGVVADLPMGDVPQVLFIFSAVLLWTFFAAATVGAARSLLDNRALLGKIYFPRLIVAIVGVLSGLINFIPTFLVLLVLMATFGYYPTWTILLVPVYLVLAGLVALAVGLWMAPWIVHFRDVANVLDYGMLGWMYATPIVYSVSIIENLPDYLYALYFLNPVTHLVQGFRWALFSGNPGITHNTGDPPNWILGVSIALVVPVFVTGLYYFRRAERSIVDIA